LDKAGQNVAVSDQITCKLGADPLSSLKL
jgi:hypothetical protein